MTTDAPFRLVILVTLLSICSYSSAQENTTNATIDGLELIDDTRLALVYVKADANLGQYNKIYLDDAYIAFKKNWQRNQNRSQAHKVSSDDMSRIKSELSSLFREVFSKTLIEGGYELVTERDNDVLLVRPSIINLDITAADTNSANRTQSFSETAGEMTLYLELYDSVTDDLIAKALDRQMDRRTGFFQWQNHVTNRAAANRILQVWANVLKEGLDDARGVN